MDEYISSRPTETIESDVYVCESIYDEVTKQIRRFQGTGLRRFTHSQMVVSDEIYHFSTHIIPARVSVSELMTQQELINFAQMEAQQQKQQQQQQIPQQQQTQINQQHVSDNVLSQNVKQEIQQTTNTNGIETGGLRVQSDPDVVCNEDSLDGASQSIGSDLASTSSPVPSAAAALTPVAVSNKKTKQKGVVTGFILYSSVVRKSVVQNNPECSFGDISRIVGNEWRSLPAADKQHWEEKARKVTAEAIEGRECSSPAPLNHTNEPLPNQVYECSWNDCDHQFEDLTDCLDHCFAENTGHVVKHFAAIPTAEVEFQCHWRDCLRVKKQSPPFPVLWRLIKHIRDVHVNKNNAKTILPRDRSK